MEEFDIDKLIEEDKLPENRINKPLRFAKAFDVNIDVKEEGLLEILPNSDKLWRLRIKSPGAYSINLTFGEYVIPDGSKVFIFNKSKTHKLGAFTEENNKPSKILAIQPVEGDEIIIEYSEPSEITNPGRLIISRLGHDYKGIFKRLNTEDGRYGQSAWCNVDINCPIGDDWQTEKRSVCRILIDNVYLCSGSLINNTRNDYKALFLTANHCISTTAEANNTVFVFYYESPSCDGPDGSVSQSISGSTLRAHWSTSDFSLVELSSMPPISYYPVWNGWDRSSSTPSAPVTCIHHPAGDVKKISIDCDPVYTEGNFWCVDNWDTGTTEGGSSGSPLYNSDKRVVGQDSYSDCIYCDPCDSDKGSCYGKISSSWNGGGTSASRLRNWLDPSGTGKYVLDNLSRQYITGSSTVCTSNSTFILQNRPSGTSVSWSKGPYLSYVSGQSTDNYTVKASSSISSGSSWVKATIPTDLDTIVFEKNIWVGKVLSNGLRLIDRMTGYPIYVFCNGEAHPVQAQHIDGEAFLDDWDWDVTNGYITYDNPYDDNSKVTLRPLNYNFDVKIRAHNSCGWSEWADMDTYTIPCGYMMFTMHPNPADDFVEITAWEDVNKTTLKSNDEFYEVQIYNYMKVLQYQALSKDPILRLNTANFENGVYFVFFKVGKDTKALQLVVNH